jgi:3-hydroxymyristoyl/3-hydroxydecanoyl-(acyl carrier protein) dehydratase
MTGWARRRIQVPESHATAAGHFPGRPIVPGALLLDEVAAILGGAGPLRFGAVKFLAPVRHGEPLDLCWQTQHGGLCRIEIRRSEGLTTVLTGTIEAMP